MTKKKGAAADAVQSAEKKAVVSSEKPIVAPSDAASDVNGRDDQDRRVVIFASIFLIALATPVFLPVQDDRSLLRMTGNDSMGLFLIGAVLGWPVCLGVIGIWQGLRKKIPGKVLIGIATGLSAFQTLAGLALVATLLRVERHAAESPFVWLGAASTVAAVGMVVRSFFRRGWQRWQHLMAPIALLALMIVLMIAGIERSAVEQVVQGGWGFLFATAALVPFGARTIASRRG